MSHLSILPTVLREPDLLMSALASLQLKPQRQGRLVGFAGEEHPVDVLVQLRGGQWLGWRRQADGSLALVADLPRVSRREDVTDLLAAISRAYAARLALREAASLPPGAVLHLVR